ncbi:AL3B2 dehydrogenase, partial [Ardeotis kori]|nr:AL3B2 dehydrogenase [Ardeotis kori]
NPYAGLVSHLRAAWLSGKTRPMEYRVAQLEALGRFLEEKKEDILEATASDMGKPSFEAYFTEILLCKNELNDTLNNLSHWMKDEHVDKNLVTRLDSAFIRKDPYGVVLIIAPWNYPIHLLLVPLIGAIAAGNCVIVKPSETSKNTERLLAEMLSCYLDNVRTSPCPCPCTRAMVFPTLHMPAPRHPQFRVCSTSFLHAQPRCPRSRGAGPTSPSPLPSQVVNQVLERTSSGGFCGNDTLMHVTLTSLPFGGIGNSGLGMYHGKFTFDTFTHHRGCLHRNMGLEALNALRYPPYSQQKLGLLSAAFQIKRRGMCTLL